MPRTSTSGELKRAIGRIQRLCVAAPGQHSTPALIEEFRAVVPFGTCGVLWAGPKQELVKTYTDARAALIIEAYVAYIGRDQAARDQSEAVFQPFSKRMRTVYSTPAGDFLERVLTVEPRKYFRSELYDTVFRPIGADKGVTVRIAEHDGRPRAALTLFRATRDPDFTAADFHLLNATAAFVAHAMQDTPQRGGYATSDDHALLVADRGGTVRHMSLQAHRLLLMACCPRLASGEDRSMCLQAPPQIARLCERLVAAEEGLLPSAPPAWRERNAWGEFVFRAQWLEDTGTEGRRNLIGITIERREPRAVVLARRIEALPLSQREKRICFLLAGYQTRAEIADFVGVSEHTVIAQQRSIYAKTGAKSRVELLGLLLGLESSRDRETTPPPPDTGPD